MRMFVNLKCLLLLELLTFVSTGDILRSDRKMVCGLMRGPAELEMRE